MARGKYLSLKEARKQGKIDRFCKEHASTGNWDKFWRLADAMAHGEPPSPRRKARASRTSSRDADMKKHFSASLWREGDWFVAQCLDVDVASQGRSEDEALTSLREALELHFEEPRASVAPKTRPLEVEVSAA